MPAKIPDGPFPRFLSVVWLVRVLLRQCSALYLFNTQEVFEMSQGCNVNPSRGPIATESPPEASFNTIGMHGVVAWDAVLCASVAKEGAGSISGRGNFDAYLLPPGRFAR